jgi:hypothetical protein
VKINDVGPLEPGRVIDLNEQTMRYFDPGMRRGLIPITASPRVALGLKTRSAIRHIQDEPAGQRDEFGRRQAKDGVWRTCGGPDVIEAHQGFIDENDRRPRVTNGWYAADGKACRFAHEIGVCTANFLADCRCRLVFVDAIVTRGEDEYWAAARRGAEPAIWRSPPPCSRSLRQHPPLCAFQPRIPTR